MNMIAVSTTAPGIMVTLSARFAGLGRTASAASTLIAMTTTLAAVPMPGRLRNGTQASSTATPTTADATPMVMPVRAATPWWKTSHGSRPRPARTMSAIDRP